MPKNGPNTLDQSNPEVIALRVAATELRSVVLVTNAEGTRTADVSKNLPLGAS